MLEESEDKGSINKVHKVFEIDKGTINYTNIQHSFLKNKAVEGLEVHNHLCKQDGTKLVKVTEVVLDNQVLEIRDEFELKRKEQPPVDPDPKPEPRIREHPFRRRNNYSDPSKG